MGAPPSFGAALVGFGCACFLCGCMLIQVYIYIKSGSARNDSLRFKGLVGFIWFVDILQLFILGCYIYGDLIVHYDDPAELGRGPWSFAMVTGLSVWVSTPVQLFYAWRVYILGQRHLILPIVISLTSLLSYSCGMATAVFAWKLGEFDKYDRIVSIVDTWLAADVITDILIVSSLYYFLTRGRTGFSQTDMIIDKLVFLIVNTGLAPTLCEVAHIISFSMASNSFAHLSFNFIGPKLYANSFMATLNARTLLFGSSNKITIQSIPGPRMHLQDPERFEMPSFAPPRHRRGPDGTDVICNDVLDIKITTTTTIHDQTSDCYPDHESDTHETGDHVGRDSKPAALDLDLSSIHDGPRTLLKSKSAPSFDKRFGNSPAVQ